MREKNFLTDKMSQKNYSKRKEIKSLSRCRYFFFSGKHSHKIINKMKMMSTNKLYFMIPLEFSSLFVAI